MPAQCIANRFQFLAHQRYLVQDAAPMFQQHHAGFGQADATPVA